MFLTSMSLHFPLYKTYKNISLGEDLKKDAGNRNLESKHWRPRGLESPGKPGSLLGMFICFTFQLFLRDSFEGGMTQCLSPS